MVLEVQQSDETDDTPTSSRMMARPSSFVYDAVLSPNRALDSLRAMIGSQKACSSLGCSIHAPRMRNSSSRIKTVGVAIRPSGVRYLSAHGRPVAALTSRISRFGADSTMRASTGTELAESEQPYSVIASIRSLPAARAAGKRIGNLRARPAPVPHLTTSIDGGGEVRPCLALLECLVKGSGHDACANASRADLGRTERCDQRECHAI